MELTKSFPPADALMETLQGIDYKKHLNTFMDAVETFCIIVAAVYIVLRDKWIQHNMTERLQLFILTVIESIKTFYAWMQNVFVPAVVSFYETCRSTYNFLRTV